MKVTKANITRAIFENHFENEFYKFIDYIQKEGTPNEFPIIMYETFFNHFVIPHPDKALLDILSISTLEESGFFTYICKKSDQVSLADQMVNFLSYIDDKRSAQLDHIQFESFRAEIETVVQSIRHSLINSDDYNEAIRHFNRVIGAIISNLKSNIETLDYKVSEIAESYKANQQGQSSITSEELYNRALRLYERNIQPCLQFIDPDNNLKQASTFIESLHALKDYYHENYLDDEALLVQYRMTSVTSYYKDIYAINRHLQRYLRSLSEDKKAFLVIEAVFSKLLDSLIPLRHGRTHHRYLNAESEIMQQMRCFDGLASHQKGYRQLFNRDPERVNLQFKMHYLDIESKSIAQKPIVLKEINIDLALQQSVQRTDGILQLMFKMPLQSYIEDFYHYIHLYLDQTLEDYRLVDFLTALSCLVFYEKNLSVQTQSPQGRITDDEYYLEHIILSYNNKELEND